MVGQGLRAALLGVLIGGIGAVALGRGMAALLFDVRPADPVVLSATVLILVSVAALAAFVPARRAARIAPMEALRAE